MGNMISIDCKAGNCGYCSWPQCICSHHHRCGEGTAYFSWQRNRRLPPSY